jgi:hypothetical protein
MDRTHTKRPISTHIPLVPLLGVFIGLVGVFCWSCPGRSQPRTGVWFAYCPPRSSPSQSECTVQIMLQPEGKSSTDLLNVSYAVRAKTFTVVGNNPARTASLTIDGYGVVPLTSCAGTRCSLSAAGSEALLSQMTGGSTLVVEMRTTLGQTIGPYKTSLRDFDLAYREAKSR